MIAVPSSNAKHVRTHKLVLVDCPLCGASGPFNRVRNIDRDGGVRKYGDIYAGVDSSVWCACSSCGFVHQNPRPTVEALNYFYLSSSYHPPRTPDVYYQPGWYESFAADYYTKKVEYSIRHSGLKSGSVFELGFGHGGALKLFEKFGWKVSGIEPDLNHFNFAKDFLKLGGLQRGILTSNPVFQEKVDMVWSNHTFEHIGNLHEVMKGLWQGLKKGGYLFTAVPTYAKNRSSMSLAWMNSGHYSMFTHRSLNHLLSLYGFEEVVHSYDAWEEEKDDLWHLARYTGIQTDPKRYYENPEVVRFYVNYINPLRSFVGYPIYGHYYTRKQFLPIRAVKILLKSPSTFVSKSIVGLRRLIAGSQNEH